jgi:glycosyltransferase involved in cell wall biosynthesis
VKRQLDEELALADGADLVLAVNEQTAQSFRAAGHDDVRMLGYTLIPRPTAPRFEARQGLLFVGPTYNEATPNTDAVVWFIDQVLPCLREKMGSEVSLVLAGDNRVQAITERMGGGVAALGVVPDLAELYARARIFVAPLRFTAGIPLKVYQAAAHGVPIVLTSQLVRDLGWNDGEETLVADAAGDFAEACFQLYNNRRLWNRIRARALARVAKDCSRRKFDSAVAELARTVTAASRRRQRAASGNDLANRR